MKNWLHNMMRDYMKYNLWLKLFGQHIVYITSLQQNKYPNTNTFICKRYTDYSSFDSS